MLNQTVSGPLIIISDTHFGRRAFETKSSRPEDLAKFFDWLNKSRNIRRKNGVIEFIKIPQKIILLGDILELWAPASEREVFSNFFPVLVKLLKLVKKDQEIIYVRGNHDQNIKRYAGKFDPHLQICDKYFAITMNLRNSTSKRIVFLHGDEFTWGKIRGASTKILGYFYRIASDLEETTRRAILALFVVFSMLYFMIFYTEFISESSIPRWVQDVYMGLLWIGGFYAIPTLSRWIGLRIIRRSAIKGTKKVKENKKLIFQREAEKMSSEIKLKFYKATQKPDYKKMKEIINGTWRTLGWNFQAWWNRNWKEKIWQPEIVIFGHTHVPEGPVKINDIDGIDRSKIESNLEGKILVNSGSWLREGEEDNTNFIYISENCEILLCKFDSDNEIGVELGNLRKPYSK